jgi:hypothetical protein
LRFRRFGSLAAAAVAAALQRTLPTRRRDLIAGAGALLAACALTGLPAAYVAAAVFALGSLFGRLDPPVAVGLAAGSAVADHLVILFETSAFDALVSVTITRRAHGAAQSPPRPRPDDLALTLPIAAAIAAGRLWAFARPRGRGA